MSALTDLQTFLRRGTLQEPEKQQSLPVIQEVHFFVEITSTSQTDGRYPGNIRIYDAAAKTWSDGGDVWVVDANGVSLSTSKQYVGRYWDNVVGVTEAVPVVVVSGAGDGDVVGPSSSTDNALVRWDGFTGKLIQNSNGILSDAGELTITNNIHGGNNIFLTGFAVCQLTLFRVSGTDHGDVGANSTRAYLGYYTTGAPNTYLHVEADRIYPRRFNAGNPFAPWAVATGSDVTPTLLDGGTATTGGLTFVGGLYISGTLSGTGITSLGGQTGATQTFADVDDTNVTLAISSGSNTHTFTMGWTGQLSLARGGTGANLSDPNADRILFWDDSLGAVTWLEAGTGLSISGTTLAATGVSDGDKGDITVSSSGTVWTIDNSVVTDAKLRDSAGTSVIGRSTNSTGPVADIVASSNDIILRRVGNSVDFGLITAGMLPADVVAYSKIQDVSAASKLLGRGSAGGSGDVEEITIGSGLLMSGTTLSATGGLVDGDYGDITISGSGTVLTIDNNVVTYAKLQDVSATDKILGRVTAGAGDVEEITFTDQAQQLADDTSFGAMLTTLGGTTVGQSFFTLANPSAITFPRINADNTVTARSAANFRADIGAGTGDVVGPSSATDLAFARFDGTTGKLLQNSTMIAADSGYTEIGLSSANTNAVVGHFDLAQESTGTVADGFGSRLAFILEESAGNRQNAGHIKVLWATATAASRKARMTLSVEDASAERECLRAQASGSAAMIGFLGASAAIQQTGDVATALETFGLMATATYESDSIVNPVHSTDHNTTSHSITSANGTYESCGLALTLPSAGQYLVWGNLRGVVNFSAGASGQLDCKLRNTTDSTDFSNGQRMIIKVTTTGVEFQNSATPIWIIDVDSGDSIEIYVTSRTATTWTTRQIAGGGDGVTTMGYLKIGQHL